MGPEVAEDRDLARRIAGGDRTALAALFDRHADLLFAFISARLGMPREEVEEVWQETWLAALRAIGSYAGRSRLSTWLAAIARNKIADHLRRRGRDADPFSVVPPEVLASLGDGRPLPDEVAARGATRARVVETLGILPDDYRAALIARYADGCGVEDVAARLGRTYKATESLLARAREAFREAFAGAEGDRSEGADRGERHGCP
ncbi:MAG: RNA polymerase sigma factor [Planctomycetes bacterium]|nr:RNA polymerase sigma factor [Planctomycetota bacterium]